MPLLDATSPVDMVTRAIHRDGYAIVDRLLDRHAVAQLAQALDPILAGSAKGNHEYLGFETRRTARLLARTRAFDELVASPYLETILNGVLGEHQLNSPSAIELLPGEVEQFWHHDDMFYPMHRPHPCVVLNTFWAIDDFTALNGATRIVPGSHRWGSDRSHSQSDHFVIAEMPAGSVAMWHGSTWHSAGANRTARSRIGLSLEFSAAWLRPQENMVLSVPPAIAADLSPRLQALLGYRATSTGLGHVGGEEPSIVFGDHSSELA